MVGGLAARLARLEQRHAAQDRSGQHARLRAAFSDALFDGVREELLAALMADPRAAFSFAAGDSLYLVEWDTDSQRAMLRRYQLGEDAARQWADVVSAL